MKNYECKEMNRNLQCSLLDQEHQKGKDRKHVKSDNRAKKLGGAPREASSANNDRQWRQHSTKLEKADDDKENTCPRTGQMSQ